MGNKKVLIVEDDEKIAQMIEKRLLKELPNIDVQLVNDGISATQQAEFYKFDLIITDLQLPRKDGLSVIKRIKFSKHNQDTPLIVVTGHPNESLMREYAPIYILEKPFKQKDMIAAATELLRIEKKALRHHHEAFQAFISGLEKILGEVNVSIHEISQPMIREAGDELPGDLQLFFDFEFDKTRMNFDISAKLPTIHRLYEESSGGKKLSTETDIQFAGDELIKMLSYEMTNYFIHLGHKPPVFFKKGSQTRADSPECSKAQSNKGFYIELKTSIGNAYIQTLVNSSKDRLVA